MLGSTRFTSTHLVGIMLATAISLAFAPVVVEQVDGRNQAFVAQAAYKMKYHEAHIPAIAETFDKCAKLQYMKVQNVPIKTYDCMAASIKVPCHVGFPFRSNVGLCTPDFWMKNPLNYEKGDLHCKGFLYYKKTASGVRRQQKSWWRCKRGTYIPADRQA
ncbi:MAG TPA: hypothetical protein VF272_01200 [Candidatus Saccharimonadia bacterium]